jgi:hypothetical protein
VSWHHHTYKIPRSMNWWPIMNRYHMPMYYLSSDAFLLWLGVKHWLNFKIIKH